MPVKKIAYGLSKFAIQHLKFNFIRSVLVLYEFIYLFCNERTRIRCSWAERVFCYSCVCVPFDLISRLRPPASAEKDWYSQRMNMYVVCTLTWTCFWPSPRKQYTYTHMSQQPLENEDIQCFHALIRFFIKLEPITPTNSYVFFLCEPECCIIKVFLSTNGKNLMAKSKRNVWLNKANGNYWQNLMAPIFKNLLANPGTIQYNLFLAK